MSCPLVSIGLPVYNGQRYLRESLDSLLGQTFADFELIISDNASVDDTEAICREYESKDSRIQYKRQASNIGVIPNFQYVLNQACGEFFMWAADDDLWDKDWLAKLTPILLNQGGTAAFGRVYPIDQDGNRRLFHGRHHALNFQGGRLRRRVAFFLECELAGKSNRFYSLFEREAILGKDLGRYKMDCYFLFDLLAELEFRSVNDLFLYKRVHGDNCALIGMRNPAGGWKEIQPIKAMGRNISMAAGYLSWSTGLERLILALLLPLKLVNMFWFRLRVRPQ